MSDKINAAEQIRRLATQYQAMVVAADTLERIGQLEQATEEAAKACAEARAERDKAIAALKKAKADALSVQAEAEQDAANIRANAEAAVVAAERRAQDIITAAEQRAAELVRAGTASMATERNRLADECDKLRADRAALQAEIDAIGVQIIDRKGEADALEGRIAKAQERIAKLLAG